VGNRNGQHLAAWMRQVDRDGSPALGSFVAGMRAALADRHAGLTLPDTSGPVEGHVNRIKLPKCQMDGRASLDLLRERVLLGSAAVTCRQHPGIQHRGSPATTDAWPTMLGVQAATCPQLPSTCPLCNCHRHQPTLVLPPPPPTDREDMVIARTWHATATTEDADSYREHFTHSVVPDLQQIDGYQGAYLLRHDHDGHVELQVLTLWDSLEAIRRFAGADLDSAVVEPAAQAVLATYDTTVTHHTVVVDTVGANARTGQ
jgi:heme-degrading monooxygenase HmoA